MAVLFDMDGVVVDSERYWPELEAERIFPEVVPDQGVQPEEVMGMYYREIYDYLDEHYAVAVDRDRFVEVFDATARELYGERAALMDGFHDLVEDLQAQGTPVGLVTSSPHPWIDVVLDRFDLDGAFDAIVSAEDVPRGKPEPDVYERAVAELGVAPERCVAVEDSPTGAAAAKAARLRCLGYTGVHDGLDPADVDSIAATPTELRTLLFETLAAE
ncbi:HAD family hydrolase [Halapricum salinum]|uniref:HAD family phosphatase n=1 Tax=Halapricum salinum TaxID=1457250 RepID=A0A4D6HBG7_9EURY|nr:HAD family phosphatase [Halapricum salinum]QCC51343.1 HAD family phosphatase [Halapricum salinum]